MEAFIRFKRGLKDTNSYYYHPLIRIIIRTNKILIYIFLYLFLINKWLKRINLYKMTQLGRFHISKFLDTEAVDNIKHWYKIQNWTNGTGSVTGYGNNIKNNLMTKDTLPDSYIWNHIDNNKEFVPFTHSHTSSKPVVTKTPVGGYYHPHFDNVTLGHFSTTIFLNSPDQYDGGELILFIDGEEVPFKLESGWGITYETGIEHRVNTVSRGERNVIIFWSYSYWNNINAFREYKYWTHMHERYQLPVCDNLYDYHNSLYVHYRRKADDLMRRCVSYQDMIHITNNTHFSS